MELRKHIPSGVAPIASVTDKQNDDREEPPRKDPRKDSKKEEVDPRKEMYLIFTKFNDERIPNTFIPIIY